MKNLFLSLLLTLLRELSSSFKPGSREKTIFKKEIKNDVKEKIELICNVTPIVTAIKNLKTLLSIKNQKSISSIIFFTFYCLSEQEVHRECTSNSGFT